MLRLKVSYQKEQELEELLNILKPILISFKTSKNDKGQYRKAYIELDL